MFEAVIDDLNEYEDINKTLRLNSTWSHWGTFRGSVENEDVVESLITRFENSWLFDAFVEIYSRKEWS